MSFTPLPKIFTDTCAGLDSSSSQIMEFGCGDGRFRGRLSDLGLACWGLDRFGPASGTVAHVVGEAGAPPIGPGSLDLLVAPNLLRHMLPIRGELAFLAGWLQLLKPGGSLFIFEDEPCAGSAAERNFRDLQVFLARLMPGSRGALFSLEDFKSRSAAFRSTAAWDFGMVRNREPIAPAPVLEMLGQGAVPKGEPGRLLRSIRKFGLDPGHYWWARARSLPEG